MFHVFYTMFGHKYRKPMFYVMNCVITTILIQLGYICYHRFECVCVTVCVCVHSFVCVDLCTIASDDVCTL